MIENCVTHLTKEKYFKDIYKRKFSRRLLNEESYANIMFKLALITVLLLVITIANIILGNKNFMEIAYIGIPFLIIEAVLIIEIENKGFRNLEMYKRQFYILYLFKNTLTKYEETRKKIYKSQMISLYYNYQRTLNDSINSIREINIFGVDNNEIAIRSFKNNFKKILWVIKKGDNLAEVKEIVDIMLEHVFLISTLGDNLFKLQSKADEYFESFSKKMEELEITEDNTDKKSLIVHKIISFFVNNLDITGSIIVMLIICILYSVIIGKDYKVGELFTLAIATFFGTITYLSSKVRK